VSLQIPTCSCLPACLAGWLSGFQAVVDYAFKGGNTGFPVRAPPILQRGGFTLCATNVSVLACRCSQVLMWGGGGGDQAQYTRTAGGGVLTREVQSENARHSAVSKNRRYGVAFGVCMIQSFDDKDPVLCALL
jgi:hypothetical protein